MGLQNTMMPRLCQDLHKSRIGASPECDFYCLKTESYTFDAPYVTRYTHSSASLLW
jgi:hypothetical protein